MEFQHRKINRWLSFKSFLHTVPGLLVEPIWSPPFDSFWFSANQFRFHLIARAKWPLFNFLLSTKAVFTVRFDFSFTNADFPLTTSKYLSQTAFDSQSWVEGGERKTTSPVWRKSERQGDWASAVSRKMHSLVFRGERWVLQNTKKVVRSRTYITGTAGRNRNYKDESEIYFFFRFVFCFSNIF